MYHIIGICCYYLLGYEKSLGLINDEQRRVNDLLGYEKGLGLLTNEQHRTNGMLGYKKGLGVQTRKNDMKTVC